MWYVVSLTSLLRRFRVIRLYYWTHDLSLLPYTGEPPCLSEERWFKSLGLLFIHSFPCSCSSCVHTQQACSMKSSGNLRWFSDCGSSPPPAILTCHFSSPQNFKSCGAKASATWRRTHGDVLLFKWRKVKPEMFFNPENLAPDCSEVWRGLSPPPPSTRQVWTPSAAPLRTCCSFQTSLACLFAEASFWAQIRRGDAPSHRRLRCEKSLRYET